MSTVRPRERARLLPQEPAPAARRRVAILGATGSIGRSTLDVLSRHREAYEVVALTAQRRVDELIALCLQWRPRYAVIAGEADAARVRAALREAAVRTEVFSGARALEEIAAHPDVDIVMAAIVGAAGLAPCIAAARGGKRLLLANKEALVLGGALFMRAVADGGATLVPIDSEHSAIFQCLPRERASWPQIVDHIVLTASGGPFRTRDAATLRDVTPDEACAHPNWVMGRKISVDSATMMNKALEVIEAHWLFGLAPERIKVVLHPQSIVHSMVVCRDASVLAQLGTPDMRVPIAYGLSYPGRVESGASRLDFTALGALTFEAADAGRFPCLPLAWQALAGPPGTTAVLNAANEEAVAAFLEGRARFTSIHEVNARTLQTVATAPETLRSVGDLIELDARARQAARAHVKELAA